MRIIGSAKELASEGGYEAVQMRSVADRSGVALGTVYRYFPSKNHLLVVALVLEFEGAARRFAEAELPGDTPHDRIMVVFRASVAQLEENPRLYDALVRATMFADASSAPELDHLGYVLTDLFARAAGIDAVTEEVLNAVHIIADVWMSTLVSWAAGRQSTREVLAQVRAHGDPVDATAEVVEGAHAPMMQHVAPAIQERVNQFFGYEAVTRVAIRQGFVQAERVKRPVSSAPSLRHFTARTNAGPTEVPEELGESLRGIADPGLKACLESLARGLSSGDGMPEVTTVRVVGRIGGDRIGECDLSAVMCGEPDDRGICDSLVVRFLHIDHDALGRCGAAMERILGRCDAA